MNRGNCKLKIVNCKLQIGKAACGFALALLFTIALLAAAPAAAQQPRSIDDELLEDFGRDPLDDFDPLNPDADKPQVKPQVKPGDELPPELLERLERKLGGAAAAEDENPLLTIARNMCEVEKRIAQNDSDKGTQDLQKKIVDDLDKLIKKAKKSCKSGSSQSAQQQASRRRPVGQPKPKQNTGSKPGRRPASTSNQRPQGGGQVEKVDMDRMRAVIKKLWGELPQHQREQMLQLPIEEFLPKYQRMIEEYFRRLAEEKQP